VELRYAMNRNHPRTALPGFAGCPCCSIIPSYLLRHLAEHGPARLRRIAFRSLECSENLRGQRAMLASLSAVALATPTGTKRRTIYDAQNDTTLPGQLVRTEGAPKGDDVAVNEAYDYSGATYDFYLEVLGRNSIDDRGLRLDSSVHYSKQYDNAFWNGLQMVYGDGDGVLFQRLTRCIEVVGHELTHGVTQFEAALAYSGPSGALNESISDVFGSLVKQWKLKQTAAKADWLIGAGLFARGVKGKALRSMAAPGTAYDDPNLGKDPQPSHMKDYYQGSDDNGGVHINSGIPNHAFYLTATALGGNAWNRAGKIWYDALCNQLSSNSNFKDAANATAASAGKLYGARGVEAAAVKSAWREVGVL
jgi:Zn-dependent metalloprotease